MCLVLKFKTRQEARDARFTPLIAKEDIIVYKILLKNNNSPFRRCQYIPGVNLKIDNFTFTIVNFGFDNYKEPHLKWHLEINQGLHTMATLEAAIVKMQELNVKEAGCKIVEFIVPAGTPYYIDYTRSEIVSLKLNWLNKN